MTKENPLKGVTTDHALSMLEQVENIIALGETRANIFVALNLAVLVGSLQIDWPSLAGLYNPLIYAWLFCSLSVLLSLAALVPQRPSGDKYSKALQFYPISQSKTPDEFIQTFRSNEDTTRRLLLAVYMRSRLANRKFLLLMFSSVFTVLGIALFGLSVVLNLEVILG
ncbi:MAG: Pycsar system effector family protein [Pseudomonadota bacterium]